MRTSITVCVLGALAALIGGWLVARWCLGLVLIAEAACAVAWAVFVHDDGRGPVREVAGPPTLAQVLERARAS